MVPAGARGHRLGSSRQPKRQICGQPTLGTRWREAAKEVLLVGHVAVDEALLQVFHGVHDGVEVGLGLDGLALTRVKELEALILSWRTL